jgi:hypothetical protein
MGERMNWKLVKTSKPSNLVRGETLVVRALYFFSFYKSNRPQQYEEAESPNNHIAYIGQLPAHRTIVKPF